MLVPANENAKLSWLAMLGRTRIWGHALSKPGARYDSGHHNLISPLSLAYPASWLCIRSITGSGFSTEASGSG
jgi:hypothetical protein